MDIGETSSAWKNVLAYAHSMETAVKTLQSALNCCTAMYMQKQKQYREEGDQIDLWCGACQCREPENTVFFLELLFKQ
jgi:hypothetical protein